MRERESSDISVSITVLRETHQIMPMPTQYTEPRNILSTMFDLKVGCLHPVACTRSGSGFLSNATLV
jgi:hypothetical protein